jgi:hypothetical protein
LLDIKLVDPAPTRRKGLSRDLEELFGEAPNTAREAHALPEFTILR